MVASLVESQNYVVTIPLRYVTNLKFYGFVTMCLILYSSYELFKHRRYTGADRGTTSI